MDIISSRERADEGARRGGSMAGNEHDGRIAVITGGGRGFGKAFGHALAQEGAHVVLVDLDGDAGEAGVL